MADDDTDSLGAVCVLFVVAVFIAYAAVLKLQHGYLQSDTHRITVLSTRTAAFMPFYAFFMYIALIAPKAYAFMIVFVTLVEGYAFYCFTSLLVTNLGGPAATVEALIKSERTLCCPCAGCCPKDTTVFYNRVSWAMFHMVVTRSVVAVIAAIAFYSDTSGGKVLYVLLNFANAILLGYSVVCLINLYEGVYEHLKNIYGVLKLILLKMSVGLIVIQGLIENFMYTTDNAPYQDDDTYNKQEKLQRGYCALVLVEFTILLIPYMMAYGIRRNEPSSSPGYKGSATAVAEAAANSSGTSTVSFCAFVGDVVRIQDVMGTLTLNGDNLKAPLSENSAGSHL